MGKKNSLKQSPYLDLETNDSLNEDVCLINKKREKRAQLFSELMLAQKKLSKCTFTFSMNKKEPQY